MSTEDADRPEGIGATDDRGAGATAHDAGATHGIAGADDPADLLGAFRLHHPRWRRWLYHVLPAAAILQWLLVAPLSVRAQVLTSESPGFDPLRGDLAAGVEPIGFFNDFFFVVWNLFPIVLWAIYVGADRLAVPWIHEIAPRIDTTEAADSIRRLRRIRDHWLPAALIVLAGVAGMAAQIPKQLGFFETGSQLYWWDWRVSPQIFTIRDVALFFNVILVVLVFWGTLFGLLIVIQAVRKGELDPDYFHPDDAGGLLPLGNALAVLILPWVAGAFLGVMGYFDHTSASEIAFRIGDVLTVAVCTLIAISLFVTPLYLVRRKLGDDIDRIRSNVHALVSHDDLGEELLSAERRALRDMHPAEHELTDTASAILVYQRLENVNGWPIDDERVYQVAVVVASPTATVLWNTINSFISTYWF